MYGKGAFRWLSPTLVLVLLLSGLAGVSFAGPAEPAPSAPAPAGGVSSIVPPPPQVVEQLNQEGRPLPDLRSFKAVPDPVSPRPLQGNIRLLAILVDFSGTAGTVTNWTTLNNLIYGPPGAGRGSVRDYYDEVSRSTITLVTVNPFSASYGWQRASQTMAYYASGQYGMGTAFPANAAGYVAEAIALADTAGVDFSQYDNDGDGEVDTLLVLHAGTGAEWSLNTNHIWSHAAAVSWMGGPPNGYTVDGVKVDRYVTVPEYWESATANATDLTIGVIAHEVAHGLFGVTDLYDLDGSSYGIGQWGLMSYGDWNGPPKWNSFRGLWVTDGSSPAWPEAWTRLLMGIDTAGLALANQSGVTLLPVETNAGAAIRLKSGQLWAQEYFILENREKIVGTYDEWLPSSGLLIWHVDEMQWSIYGGWDNDNECASTNHCGGTCFSNHYLVALEQADGQDHMERLLNVGDGGDPFPGSASKTSWRPYALNPVNPESGTWFDSGCTINSCLDVINIAYSAPNITLDINQAACGGVDADLGDAPASWNNYGNAAMTAYPAMPPLPAVQAWFPTVYMGVANPPGPRHHFAQVDAWLGPPTPPTGEFNADWLPDQDGPPNIIPLSDIADMDSLIGPRGYDDGLALPVPLMPCGYATLQYTVSVRTPAPYGTPMTRYVNAWFDWNRDGDWGDTVTCPGGLPAPEWAVQDQQWNLPQGMHVLLSPPFVAAATIAEGLPFEAWMRLSLSEMPAISPGDGRGSLMGYDLGETEDYRLTLYPPLQLTLDPPGAHPPGQQIIYHIGYQAVGNVLGAGATISDVLPVGIDYVGAVPPGTYDPGSRTVTWTNINLDPNQPGSVDLIVQVSGTPGQTITNTAYLLWANTRWTNAQHTFQVACAPTDPQAAFTWSQPACAGNAVQFTDLSSGTPPLTYAWDLDGDGDTDSTAQHPSWSYGALGSYTVTLTVTNACGQGTAGHVVDVLQPLAAVLADGPAGLLVGQEGTYTAAPLPPDASAPSYSWDNGSAGITATYSWDAPGLYAVTATASNACGAVQGSMPVLVSSECVSLTGVTIAGPASLQAGMEGTYTAAPLPPTATNPAYLWSDGTTGASAVYSWTTPGRYDIQVDASNCQGAAVSETLSVLVTSGCVSLTGVTIAGPTVLDPGEVGIYGASPAPPTATNPAYAWDNGLTGPTASYAWTLPGSYAVTVTASNCQGVVVEDSLPVLVRSTYRIYLPVILRAGP